MPSTINGTELSSQEFRDALLMRYSITPPDLPQNCDGCGARFSLQHALGCKKGGLVILRHNDVKSELMELGQKALTNSAIRDEPLITPGRMIELDSTCCTTPNPDAHTVAEDRGGVLMRGFWERGTGCIFGVRVAGLDAPSQRHQVASKVLANHEKQKKRKYLESCSKQRRHFTPFVVSTDGMLGREANHTLKHLARMLSRKWHKPYSQVCGYVKSRMSIAIVRATHQCLRGSRIPTQSISRRPLWEDGAGLSLYRY